MEATEISHVAICVRDMENSLAFYRDILGMRVTLDRVEDTTRGGLPQVYQHPHKTRRIVYLRYGEGHTSPALVLTTHPDEDPEGEPIKLDQVGISHPAFTVRNVKALAEELVSKGVQLAAPLEAFTNPEGRILTIFAYDPDGILIQFDLGMEA